MAKQKGFTKAETIVSDVTMMDHVNRRRNHTVDGHTEEEEVLDILPEDLMAELNQYIGDGKARVTVGAELASSVEFGNKAQAFVSISVACDNSEEAIEAVHQLLYDRTEKFVVQDHAAMSVIRDSMVTPGQELGARCPTVEEEEAPAKTPKEVHSERPQKSASKATEKESRPKAKLPDFRRG